MLLPDSGSGSRRRLILCRSIPLLHINRPRTGSALPGPLFYINNIKKEKYTMQLVDITSENWEDVIFLTTNETITVKGS